MIFFTSDLHFHHANILHLGKGRPYRDQKEMHEHLIHNWNSRIQPKDLVYVLGDFSFGNKNEIKDILSKLNGIKVLILGNHDRSPKDMLECGFSDVFENIYIYLQGKKGKHKVFLSHFPYRPTVWDWIKAKLLGHYWDVRYRHKRMVNDGEWLLHGHTHSDVKQRGKMIHIGVDAWNYSPVPHTSILKILEGS